ncbi:hypothetical protein [Kaarinaea lacus]
MSGYSISETATLPNSQPVDSQAERTNAKLGGRSTTNAEKGETHQSNEENKNLPVIYQAKNIVGAGQLLAHRYPVEYTAESYAKARQELYYVFLGIGVFIFLAYLGWAATQQVNFLQGGGFVYNSGLIGGILMLFALAYAMIKRIGYLRRHVTSDTWYYIHIACGAIGAFLVLLHSSFDLSSINSSVAFYCMLLVIISGAMGRYLLTLLSIILHKQYAEVRSLEPELFSELMKYNRSRTELIHNRLTKFAIRCFKQPRGILKYVMRLFSIPYHGMYFYTTSARQIGKIVKSAVKNSKLSKTEIRLLKTTKKQQLRYYVFSVVKMGYITLLEQLLLHWRVLHIPLLYILTITSTVHVVVVHMY